MNRVFENFHDNRGHGNASIAVAAKGIFTLAFIDGLNDSSEKVRWNMLKVYKGTENLFKPYDEERATVLQVFRLKPVRVTHFNFFREPSISSSSSTMSSQIILDWISRWFNSLRAVATSVFEVTLDWNMVWKWFV